MSFFKRRWTLQLFLTGVMISWFMHAPFRDLPPYSQHTWRQTMTLTVADNFYQEDMNIFRPRVNNRGTTEGVTGMHFPLYEYVVALGYHIFGTEFWVHRILSFLLTAWGAWLLLLLTRSWFQDEATALIAGLFYLFSPELFFNGFTALPDVMALPLTLLGLWAITRWWKEKRFWQLIVAIFGFMIGGLIKLQYLGIGIIVLGYFIRDWKQVGLKDYVQLGLFALLSVAPVLLWYKHSTWLIETSGMADIGLQLKPAESLSFALYVIRKNIIMDLPEVLLGYIATFGLLSACYWVISKKIGRSHHLFWPLIFFVIGFSIYHMLELRVLEHHQYYMMPYLAVLLPVSARGLTLVVKKKSILVILLLGHIVLCGLRMIPSRFAGETHVAQAFWNDRMREELRETLKPYETESLVITGPDESVCINFYFLNSQGWGFRDSAELVRKNDQGVPYIESWARQGARFFVTDEQGFAEIEEVSKFLGPMIKQVGEFRVYPVIIPEK